MVQDIATTTIPSKFVKSRRAAAPVTSSVTPTAPTNRPTYYDLVNADGTFNRSVVMVIAAGRARIARASAAKIGWSRSWAGCISEELVHVWEYARDQRRAEFEWRNFKPLRPAAPAELKLAA